MKSDVMIARMSAGALLLGFMASCPLFAGQLSSDNAAAQEEHFLTAYADEVVEPPSNLWGSREVNKFPFQKQYVNLLVWSPSPSPDIAYYNIYREGALLASVSAEDKTSYIDYAIDWKKWHYTYEVTAVNWDEIESSPLTIVID